MEAQAYLDLTVNEIRVFMEKTIAYRRQFDAMFQKASTQDEVYEIVDGFNEDELRDYFASSEILIDSQIMFQKIASFVYFAKILKIELDLDSLSEINGLLDFVTNYKPFETNSVMTSEGELQEKNNKVSEKKFKEFEINLKRTRALIDERRS